jgi:hypothetical protein
MGLALLFYLGDPAAITNAFESCELERFEDPAVVSHSADFSLHLIPRDLDFLSRAIGETVGRETLDFRPFLNIIHDEPDGGMFSVDPVWVRYVASVPLERAHDVASSWAVAAGFARGDPGTEESSDASIAVRELIQLCKAASSNDGQVFHIWYA